MTHPPNVRTAQEQARPRPPAPVPAPQDPGVWAVTTGRLRAAATTEPGRLRIIGAALALLVVAFGAVTALEVQGRADAANDVVGRSQQLSKNAADLYKSLASADTAVTGDFLVRSEESDENPGENKKNPDARKENIAEYEQNITLASRLLVEAAADTDASTNSGHEITTLSQGLPRYTGLIERARANNRLGYPLGSAYLRYANQEMTVVLLPAAERLYQAETDRLDRDSDDARAWPFFATGLGVVALVALGWAQRRNYRGTNRVFNHGLLVATAASTVLLLWLAVGQTVARSELRSAELNGQRSLKELNAAWISSLRARADENVGLVARGSVLAQNDKDKYETEFAKDMAKLKKQLENARKYAEDNAGRSPVKDALTEVGTWERLHGQASADEKLGKYESALDLITKPKNSTAESFSLVDKKLDGARTHEQGQFAAAAKNGRGALSPLPVGAALIAVLGAAAAIVGINRRLSEYR
ncbi:hypothetical protein [Streptomyces sp. NPDC014734]|uniref:hypothetical protein n=1 Tax=Streptomyces sp. NPDC014734 TaxID=3364886 RepID=UPI0036FF4DE2